MKHRPIRHRLQKRRTVLLGNIGEWLSLTREERMKMVEIVGYETKGKIALMPRLPISVGMAVRLIILAWTENMANRPYSR